MRVFVALLGLAGWICDESRAAEFFSPPAIENRRVQFSWAPDEDDPVFNGNTVLEPLPSPGMVHGAGHAVLLAALFGSTNEAISYAEGENEFLRYRTTDGLVLGRRPLQIDGATVRALDLHGSGRYILGALDDGTVALWDLSVEGEPDRVKVTDAPLNDARFATGVFDETDLRFVVAGADSSVYVYQSPSERTFRLSTPDGAPTAVLMVPSATTTRVVAGGTGRNLRVWDLSAPQSPRKFEGWGAPIHSLAVTPNLTRVAATDDAGDLRFFTLVTGVQLGQTTIPGVSPVIAFAAPEGAVLFVGTSAGALELRDGVSGQLFRSRPTLASAITSLRVARDARRLILGDAMGSVSVVRAGRCVPTPEDPVCFGGYMLWRSTTPLARDAILLRTYNFGDSSWSFAGETRAFTDPDSIIGRVRPPRPDDPDELLDPTVIAGPHNGVPYFYSLTRFDRQFLNGAVFPVLRNSIEEGFYRDPGSGAPTAVITEAPARADTPLLGNVYTVPNPCEVGKVPWEKSSEPHLEFRNLPAKATIRIYNVAGDLVRVLEHASDRYGIARAAEVWDLRNSSGLLVSSGVYVYQVETPSGEAIQSYLSLVR